MAEYYFTHVESPHDTGHYCEIFNAAGQEEDVTKVHTKKWHALMEAREIINGLVEADDLEMRQRGTA